jgi:hypothetical protein
VLVLCALWCWCPTFASPSGWVFYLRFLLAGYHLFCLHDLFMLVLWFWSILWRLESRRCCTCLRCEFYPAELSVMHFLISIVLRRRLMMIVSALVSMGWVITGFYVSSSYSLSSCTSFSILYRIDNQTSWLVWSFALVPLLSIACDVSSEIFESHDLVNTFYCVLPVCSVLLPWRFPTSDWVFLNRDVRVIFFRRRFKSMQESL